MRQDFNSDNIRFLLKSYNTILYDDILDTIFAEVECIRLFLDFIQPSIIEFNNLSNEIDNIKHIQKIKR